MVRDASDKLGTLDFESKKIYGKSETSRERLGEKADN